MNVLFDILEERPDGGGYLEILMVIIQDKGWSHAVVPLRFSFVEKNLFIEGSKSLLGEFNTTGWLFYYHFANVLAFN